MIFSTTKKIFFIGLATTLCFGLSGCISRSVPRTAQSNASPSATQEIKPVVTEASYQAAVKNILAPVWTSHDVAGMKDAIIALTVPPADLDFHFDVVVVLDAIEQGQKKSDQAKIKQGFDQLDALAVTYAWLK